MVSRGEVALILAALGLESGMIASSMFTVLIIVVLVTTISAPLLLKMTFGQKRARDTLDKEINVI